METTQAIHAWRSIRKFKSDSIPDDTIRAVLEAGRRAPSWENVQPWHFLVVKDKAIKEKLVLLTKGQNMIEASPAVICIIGDLSAWEKQKNRKALIELISSGAIDATIEIIDDFILKDPVYCVSEHGPSVILARTFEQLGIALGFMCIEAVNQGIGACIVGAFGNKVTGGDAELYEEIKTALGLPEYMYLLSMIVLGVPDEKPAARPRKPFDSIVSRGKIGVKF